MGSEIAFGFRVLMKVVDIIFGGLEETQVMIVVV